MADKQDRQHKQPSEQLQPDERRRLIVRLNKECDLVGWQTYLGRKTKYGDRRGPTAWHFTQEYLAKYAPGTDPQTVIEGFKSAGLENEVDAALWLALHQEEIP